MMIERYSHVMHIVSNVVGELALAKQLGFIQSLLPSWYSWRTQNPGMRLFMNSNTAVAVLFRCHGYYDFEGQLDSAITIRTMVVRNHTVSVQAVPV